MEMTLLERTLETELPKLGLTLGEPQYEKDLEFEAQTEDMYPTNLDDLSTNLDDLGIPKLKEFTDKFRRLSKEQRLRDISGVFLRRRTKIPYGLGFEYEIRIPDAGEMSEVKPIADKVITDREFGKTGSESLTIYYSSQMFYINKIIDGNSKPKAFYCFYNLGWPLTSEITIDVSTDLKMGIIDTTPDKADFGILKPVIQEIYNFDKRIFDEKAAEELIGYIGKLKQLVDLHGFELE